MDEMMSISKSIGHERDYSSEVKPSNTNRMILALKSHSGVRPDGLSADEQRLWDAVEEAMNKVANRPGSMASPTSVIPQETSDRSNSPTFPPNAATKRINQLEEQLREARAELKTKEEEHDTEVRAIQRVLAEISSDREEETQIQNGRRQSQYYGTGRQNSKCIGGICQARFHKRTATYNAPR